MPLTGLAGRLAVEEAVEDAVVVADLVAAFGLGELGEAAVGVHHFGHENNSLLEGPALQERSVFVGEAIRQPGQYQSSLLGGGETLDLVAGQQADLSEQELDEAVGATGEGLGMGLGGQSIAIVGMAVAVCPPFAPDEAIALKMREMLPNCSWGESKGFGQLPDRVAAVALQEREDLRLGTCHTLVVTPEGTLRPPV